MNLFLGANYSLHINRTTSRSRGLHSDREQGQQDDHACFQLGGAWPGASPDVNQPEKAVATLRASISTVAANLLAVRDQLAGEAIVSLDDRCHLDRRDTPVLHDNPIVENRVAATGSLSAPA
jgi:hypothetical protein